MIATGEGKMTNGLKAKTAMFTIFLILATVLAMSCKECPTEQPNYDIYLSAEDVFSTSVVLSVTLPDSGDVSTFALDRDDSTVGTYICYDDDTLIIDEGLTPNTDYIYRVRFLKDGKTKSESDPVSVHTMDTTSHEFIWEIDTLGYYGSYLKDVWVVDENNIWVVGNIETDSGEYNAARWNGTEWELMGIYSNTLDLYSIRYFSENDIWVLASYPIHWDGEQWTHYHLTNMGVIPGGLSGEIWGTSSQNVYFVGRYGRIVHYDGSTFTKMESGTDVDLVDIWGINNDNIWVCGYTEPVGTVIVHFNGKQWSKIHSLPYEEYIDINTEKVSGPISSIWTDSPNYLWTVNYWGFYNLSTDNPDNFIRYPDVDIWRGWIYRLRGTGPNDILFCGDRSAIWHYNGDTFESYPSISGHFSLRNIDINDQCYVVVGADYSSMRAVVIRGTK